MSGLAAIWCAARSRPRTRSAISLMRPTAATNLNTNLLAAGDPLAEVQREAEHGLAFAQKVRFGLVIDIIAAQLGLIRTLRGLTPTFGSFDDEQFDELRIERHLASNPDLGAGRVLVLDPQAAGALLCRRLCGGPRGVIEGATAAVDIAVTVRNGGVSLLRRAVPRRILRFRSGRRSGSSMSRLWPRTTDSSRSGRRIARRISRTAPRWSAPRSPASKAATLDADAPLRTGHPLGPRKRLCPQRGARQRARRALLRGARLREDRACCICETPGTATCAGEPMARCGNSMSCIRTSGRKSQRPVRRARSGRRSNTWISRP